MRKSIILTALMAGTAAAGAQTTLGLKDLARLEQCRAAMAASRDAGSDATVNVLVRYASAEALDRLTAAGAVIAQQEQTVAVVSLPAYRVEELLATPGVLSASLPRRHRLLNDRARAATGVDDVQNGTGLDRAYTGDGVIVGIFDGGLDPNHINFTGADGESRVKHVNVYSQRYLTSPVSVTTYDTPSAIATFNTDSSDETHGTHVLGIATGSFAESPSIDYHGVAPGAEIFICAGLGTSDEILQALNDMGDYAMSTGKPMVVNMSLGDNEGAHDGTDEFSVAMDEIAERTGIHLFLAAGNEGAEQAGIYKEFTAADNTLRTCMVPSENAKSLLGYYTQGQGDIELWSDDDTPFELYLDLIDKTNPGTPLTSLRVPVNSGAFLANGTTPSGVPTSQVNRDDEEFNKIYAQSYIGAVTAVAPQNNRYAANIHFSLTARSASTANTYVMAIRVVGQEGHKVYGYVDTSYDDYYGYAYFPVGFQSLNLAGYTESDGNGSISGMACGRNVIAVGSFNSRQVPSNSLYEKYPVLGEPSSFSSWGILPGGRVKPDICAPGQLLVSSMSAAYVRANSRYLTAWDTPKYYEYTDPATAKTHYWTYMGGTSMATPFMTGVAALWLQANPYLSTEDIRAIAQATATEPETPSAQWGASGKVDALAGIKMAAGYTGVANVTADRGNDGGIIIASPSHGVYEAVVPGAAGFRMAVTDMGGATLRTVDSAADSAALDLADLAPGVYIITVTADRATRSVKVAL